MNILISNDDGIPTGDSNTKFKKKKHVMIYTKHVYGLYFGPWKPVGYP